MTMAEYHAILYPGVQLQELQLNQYLKEPSEYEELFLMNSSHRWSANDVDAFKKQPPKFSNFIPKDIIFSNLKKKLIPATTLDSSMFPPNENILILPQERYFETLVHKHEFIEMMFVYSGSCRQVIDGKVTVLEKGDICIMDTNTYHSVYCPTVNDILVNCWMRKEYFDTLFLSRLSENRIFSSFLINAFNYNSPTKYIIFQNYNNRKIKELFIKILNEYFYKEPCYKEIINSYLIILFSILQRNNIMDIKQIAYNYPMDIRITEILRYIQQHSCESTLVSTAKEFNLSTAYLSRIFSKYTHKTFTCIRNEARILQAAILLKSTTEKVTAIAEEVGYSNMNYFYKIFRKKYGQTPAEYRKKVNR